MTENEEIKDLAKRLSACKVKETKKLLAIGLKILLLIAEDKLKDL